MESTFNMTDDDFKTIGVDPGDIDYSTPLHGLLVAAEPASNEAAATILAAAVDDIDGRSQWYWFRTAGGDLIFGCFPCGDTYFSTELERGV